MLLLSAAGIAILLYVVVQSVAEQIAQESQDNILAASAISILDSARVVEGEISIDLPYSSLSMLDRVTDERAFYAIRLNDEFLSPAKIYINSIFEKIIHHVEKLFIASDLALRKTPGFSGEIIRS